MMLLLFIGSAGSGVIGMSMSVIPVESVPLQYSGLAIGLTIGIGELIGGFLNPMVNGALADMYGIQTPLFVAAGAASLHSYSHYSSKKQHHLKLTKLKIR